MTSAQLMLAVVLAALTVTSAAEEVLNLVSASPVEMQLDQRTGNLLGMNIGRRAIRLQPPPLPVSLRVDGKWWHDTSPAVTPLSVQRRADNAADIAIRIGKFRVTLHYRLEDGVLQKRVTLSYEGDGTPKVDGVMFWLPAISLGDDAVVLSPHLEFLRVPVTRRLRFDSDLATGAWCALHSPSQRMGVAALFYGETEHFNVTVQSAETPPHAMRISHFLRLQDRVQKGWTAELGTQLLAVGEGDEQAALARLWDGYELLGVRPPTDTPRDVFEGAVYSTWSDYRNLLRLLPHLQQLGVKTIWLLPYTPGVYAPRDYYAIRPEVGTAEDLKSLVADAHRRQMRVLLDLIPHGPRPESELSKQHPDWVCRDERGRFIYWWGCFAFDYAHEGWRRYMAEVAAHFARDFGVDGWRVDVAPGGPPNWAVTQQPPPRRRPSQSGLWGGLQILDESRAAVKAARGDAIFYPEASGPPFVAHSDIVYEFPLAYLLRRLPQMDTGQFVAKLRRWLQHQRYTFPRGGTRRLVRYLENHDMPNAQQVFGIAPARALFALIASLEGVPFLFEDEDLGATPFIERVMRLRSALRELIEGDADYLDVVVDADAVFAVHRHSLHHTMVLVNLSSGVQRVRVRLPQAMSRWKGVADAWTGKVHAVHGGTVSLAIPPYEPAYLTDSQRARELAPAKYVPSLTAAHPTVSVGDDGSLRLDEMLTGQWQEGAFKLAPGERLPVAVENVQRRTRSAEGTAAFQRRMGGEAQTGATIRWRWIREGDCWRCGAQLQLPPNIKLARHDLAWRFTFTKPLHWRAETLEGSMDDIFVPRRPQTQVLWDTSRLLPLPDVPPLTVQLADGRWWILTEWRGDNLRLNCNPDETLTAELMPDGQQQWAFAFRLADRLPEREPPRAKDRVAFDGARMIVQTPSARLSVARNLGGLPVRLELKDRPRGTWDTVLVNAELYSDYGIYPDHDEGGVARSEGEQRMKRTVGRASLCRVPEQVRVHSNAVSFEGALSTSWAGHWWHLTPRIGYQLRYETDGDAVVLRASVTPAQTLHQVKGFLALTLTFTGVERVAVRTAQGDHEVPELGERDWQSRLVPFARDAAEIRLQTRAGRIALDRIKGALQNCFVLKDGDRCTVFFAWLDGESTDFADQPHPLQLRLVPLAGERGKRQGP